MCTCGLLCEESPHFIVSPQRAHRRTWLISNPPIILLVPKACRRDSSQAVFVPFQRVWRTSWCTVTTSSAVRLSDVGVMSSGRRDPRQERKIEAERGSCRKVFICGAIGAVSCIARYEKLRGLLACCMHISCGLTARLGLGCLPCRMVPWQRVT